MLMRLGSSPAKAAAPHFTANVRNMLVNRNKKSSSIHNFNTISPTKFANNPQERLSREGKSLNRNTLTNVKPLAAAINHINQQKNTSQQRTKVNGRMSQNLSYNNIRTTFSPVPFVRKVRQLNKIKQNPSAIRKQAQSPHFELGKNIKKIKDDKKCSAPSFIKNKTSNNHVGIQDFKLIKMLIEEHQYKEFIAEHKKTLALFTIKCFKKQLCQQFKFYVKTCDINHSLIVRFFENIYLVQQFLDGENLNQFMSRRQDPLSEQQTGSKICEILTALTYLHSINFSYGNINQSSIVNSLSVCKLKRPQLKLKKKCILFDIWCLGKLTFELVTSSKLINEQLLTECQDIDDIFNSSEIVLALEAGFKKFENGGFSRDLITFLITTLWQIQGKTLTLQQVWQQQFMKIYKEEDIWTCQGEK